MTCWLTVTIAVAVARIASAMRLWIRVVAVALASRVSLRLGRAMPAR